MLDSVQSNVKEGKTSTPASPLNIKRHSDFYMDNTMIEIQVGDVLFNVHKYQLVKSKFFARQLDDPKRSPNTPIIVPDVTATDFTKLLRVLYPPSYAIPQPTPNAELLFPIFKLANHLEFEELRDQLKDTAEKELSDVDKIELDRQYKIGGWLGPAHTRLCQRREPLTPEEARRVGVDILLFISLLREEFYQPTLAAGTNMCTNCAGYNLNNGNNNYKCGKCTGVANVLTRKTQPDSAAIDQRVKKWVEDGCVFPQ
ncbi:The BTB (BR-C, ttk and bab)/POZ (Pox virus and Zinc finger) domain [Ceratobasidium sp. AG-Ba]|nr:The BTB (BR-C, ttk and bab)/POZ (Pox virus and Zinc finger) domain [Ceratobasidium sp. AG-Ba]